MKTKEELNALKEGVEAMSKKLAELSEDELKEVTAGSDIVLQYKCRKCGKPLLCTPAQYQAHIEACKGLVIVGYSEDNTKELDDLLNYRQKFID